MNSTNSPIENHLKIHKTGRYVTHGHLNNQTTDIWLVIHGYGQLAKYFIQKFHPLAEKPSTAVIAPEGLHRFYLSGHSGRVGASWMTKEDRENDIHDYCLWIDEVVNETTKNIDPNACRIHLLGFSQGTATAGRWLLHTKYRVSSLVLWGGLLAHDLEPAQTAAALKNLPVYFVYGENDPFLDYEKIGARHAPFEKAGINFRKVTFKGKHDIHQETLQQISNELA